MGKGAPSLVPRAKGDVRGKLAASALRVSKLVTEQQESTCCIQLAWPPAQLATFTPRRTLGKAARPPRWQDKGSLGSCRRRDRCRHGDVPSAHTELAAPGEQGGHQQKPLLASLPAAPFPAPPLKFTTAAFLPGGEESLTHALEEINKRAEKMGSSHPAGSMNHCCSSLPHVLFQH